MIDPVDLDDFFIAFFSAAMIILMGAAYALFFTFAKLNKRKILEVSAYLSYGLLAVSVFFLSDALNLNGYWQVLVWLMRNQRRSANKCVGGCRRPLALPAQHLLAR